MSHINRFNAAGYPDPTAYEALTRVEAELHLSAFRPIVYICSPFSGDTETNLENARRYSRFAVEQGYLPITPHLLFPQFMDDSVEAERNLAMRMNIILLTTGLSATAFQRECPSRSHGPDAKARQSVSLPTIVRRLSKYVLYRI